MIWVGAELRLLYNDACIPFLGHAKHPAAVGAPGISTWAEIWPAIGPLLTAAQAGRSTFVENCNVFFTRSLAREEVYASFGCTPILGEDGRTVEGVFSACTETTTQVINAQRISTLRELADDRCRPHAIETVCRNAAQVLLANALDLAFAAIYLLEEDRETVRFMAGARVPQGLAAFPASLTLSGDAGRSPWPLAEAARHLRAVEVPDLPDRVGLLPTPPWGEPVLMGLVLPLVAAGPPGLAGFLIVGTSPHRVLDAAYREFFALAAGIIAASLAEARRRAAEEEQAAALHEAVTRLQVSEARLKAAVKLAGLSLYSWDPTTNALDWDNDLRAMWGLPPNVPVDMDMFYAGVHPEDRERVSAAVAACIDPARDSVYHIEYRVIGILDGVERWVSTYGETLFREGRPVEFNGAACEITERKRAEQELRESEKRFRQFANYATDMLWILQPETMQLEYLSPAFEAIWGRPVATMLGPDADWAATVHPDDRARTLHAREKLLRGEFETIEYRILRTDGVVRRIRDTSFPIRDAEGRISRIGGIAQDITKHEFALAYVIAADKADRQQLSFPLQRAGLAVKAFASERAFLNLASALVPGCVVVDMRGAIADGLTVPRELKAWRSDLPVVMLGDSAAEPWLGVRAMKAGAIDFLDVSSMAEELLAAVTSATSNIREAAEHDLEAARANRLIAAMSTREREVLEGLLAGETNKAIGKRLGISPRTVENYRSHVMERLGVRTLPEAVLMAARAGLRPSQSSDQG
jgi:PAS domain S-box-containing protein